MTTVPTFAGIASTVIFAWSVRPMLAKAHRTRDLASYSLGNLVLANVGNAVHSVYVFSLPVGPIWVLHGFYLATDLVPAVPGVPRSTQTTPEGVHAFGNDGHNQQVLRDRLLEVDEQEMLSYRCQSRTEGAAMDLRLELVSVPLTDVDRAKAFYVDQVGFGVEQDVQVDENHRFVELMPPGSPCSIALTTGYIDSQPGCLKGVQRSTSRTSMRCTHSYAIVMLKCPRSRTTPEGRFCFFSDPDGNGWSVHGPLHPE